MRTVFAELLVLVVFLLSFSYGLEKRAKVVSSWENAEGAPNFDNFTTPEMIQYFGYPAEIYSVVTTDGYILEMHRIPHGINGSGSEPRPVALLVHCLLCSSSDFIMNYPDRAIAYIMADAGYDVWLTNVRGNTYSRAHETYNPDGREFWQFSWGQMADFDVTISIDYILQATGQSQLYYVGYSMGTTMFFALMSDHPEYADKIVASALMGPVAYDAHIKGPIRALANYSSDIDTILTLLGHGEILPSGPLMDYLAENFCAEEDKTSPICQNLLFLICGYDPEELNDEWLENILTHTPAGTSVHTVNHYAQLIYIDAFQNYDWGLIGNQNHYGSNKPPVYNISGKTPPIALFWGQNDWLATPEDLEKTASELQNVALNHRVEWDSWNHLDFIWGIHAKEYVYDYLMDFLSNY